MHLTQGELAELAGYSTKQLSRINAGLDDDKKLFVKAEGAGYDVASFVQHWVQYNVSKAMGDVDDFDKVKTIHEKVKTRKTELEVSRMEGSLVDARDVRKLWGDEIQTMKQGLFRLPGMLAPMLQGEMSIEVIKRTIDAEIRRALEDFADGKMPDYAKADEGPAAEE